MRFLVSGQCHAASPPVVELTLGPGPDGRLCAARRYAHNAAVTSRTTATPPNSEVSITCSAQKWLAGWYTACVK